MGKDVTGRCWFTFCEPCPFSPPLTLLKSRPAAVVRHLMASSVALLLSTLPLVMYGTPQSLSWSFVFVSRLSHPAPHLPLRSLFIWLAVSRAQALSLLGRLCSGVITERETQAYMEQRGLRGFLAGSVLLEVCKTLIHSASSGTPASYCQYARVRAIHWKFMLFG